MGVSIQASLCSASWLVLANPAPRDMSIREEQVWAMQRLPRLIGRRVKLWLLAGASPLREDSRAQVTCGSQLCENHMGRFPGVWKPQLSLSGKWK